MKDALNLADLGKDTSVAVLQQEHSGERICRVFRVPVMPDTPGV